MRMSSYDIVESYHVPATNICIGTSTNSSGSHHAFIRVVQSRVQLTLTAEDLKALSGRKWTMFTLCSDEGDDDEAMMSDGRRNVSMWQLAQCEQYYEWSKRNEQWTKNEQLLQTQIQPNRR